MTDALALVAVSQLVCIGAIGYLYMQLQSVKNRAPQRVRRSPRVQSLEHPIQAVTREATGRAVREAYAAATPSRPAPRAARPAEGAVDVAELARRMNRSEEEVRLLLRRRGLSQ